MLSCITKIKPGDTIKLWGRKNLVLVVYPYVALIVDYQTKLKSCANIGELVMAGIESSNALLKFRYLEANLEYRKRIEDDKNSK